MDPARGGRGDWIRTSDIVLPKHALYQTELLPEPQKSYEFARLYQLFLRGETAKATFAGRSHGRSREPDSIRLRLVPDCLDVRNGRLFCIHRSAAILNLWFIWTR